MVTKQKAGKARPEMACGSPNEKKNMASGRQARLQLY